MDNKVYWSQAEYQRVVQLSKDETLHPSLRYISLQRKHALAAVRPVKVCRNCRRCVAWNEEDGTYQSHRFLNRQDYICNKQRRQVYLK